MKMARKARRPDSSAMQIHTMLMVLWRFGAESRVKLIQSCDQWPTDAVCSGGD